jgi:DNA-binding NarL/FixJ family response regulator
VADEPSEGAADDGRVRVMIVDDHPMFRDGVRADLERSGVGVVVAEASDGGEAIEAAREAMPDVILMDLSMPTVHGTDATREIVAESPHVKIIVLTLSEADEDVVAAMKAGAAGYVLKSAPTDEVVDAVRRVLAGEHPLSPRIAGAVIREMRDPTPEPGTTLTRREQEILRLIAKGYAYKEIGQQLWITHKTVQNHVQNILTKLQMRSRYELMRYAIQRGLDRGPDHQL